MVIERESYLAQLLKKKADILRIQKETGKNISSMIGEVDRQIQQALKGYDPIKGEEATTFANDD